MEFRVMLTGCAMRNSAMCLLDRLKNIFVSCTQAGGRSRCAPSLIQLIGLTGLASDRTWSAS